MRASVLCLLLSAVLAVFDTKSSKPTIDNVTRKSSEFSKYNHGDVVGKFKLVTKLDALGLPSNYIRDDSWGFQNDASMIAYNTSNKMNYSDIILLQDKDIRYDQNCVRNGTFCLNENIFNGGHGEVWRAFKLTGSHGANQSVNHSTSFILKRMHIKDRPDILRCAIREIYFGELLSHNVSRSNASGHRPVLFAQYITYFMTSDDYWLVFKDEGISLQQSMYAPVFSDKNVLLRPSKIWRNMRTTVSGEVTLKGIMYQLLTATHELHQMGVTHRDLKPSNILLNVETEARLLIADFSSAVSRDVLNNHLYAPFEPSIREETLLYAPPEVLLSVGTSDTSSGTQNRGEFYSDKAGEIAYHASRPTSYDMWSIGVVFLELLLGTAEVFTASERSANIITQRLRKRGIRDERAVQNAILLSALSDFCIYDPRAQGLSDEQPTNPVNQPSGLHSLIRLDVTTGSPVNGETTINIAGQQHSLVRIVEGGETCTPDAAESQLKIAEKATSILNSDVADKAMVKAEQPPSGSSRLNSGRHRHEYPVSRPQSPECGIRELSKAILRRDTLGRGFNSYWGLDLLSKLLRFDPEERISAGDALLHAYFTGAYISVYDNSEHATKEEMDAHNRNLVGDYTASPASGTPSSMDGESSGEWTHLTVQTEDKAIVAGSDLIESHGAEQEQDLEEEQQDLQYLSSLHFEEYPILLHPSDHCDANASESGAADISGMKGVLGDRKLSTNQHVIVDGILRHMEFTCPHCKRRFLGDYNACHKHATSRKHAQHCHYDPSTLPACLSDHSPQPLDPQSGWCDLQGTRQYIEDVHAMYYTPYFNLYGVMDGHFGSSAAKFAGRKIFSTFNSMLNEKLSQQSGNCTSNMEVPVNQSSDCAEATWSKDANKSSGNGRGDASGFVGSQEALLAVVNGDIDFRSVVSIASDDEVMITGDQQVNGVSPVTASDLVACITAAFLQTNAQFTLRSKYAVAEEVPRSGSTATTVLLFENHILVAHVGDSRVVACCEWVKNNDGAGSVGPARPVQLTLDHTPYSSTERRRVLNSGGWIDDSGSVQRVNGQLAVTRSIGDIPLSGVITAVPDVVLFRFKRSDSYSYLVNESTSLQKDQRHHVSHSAVRLSDPRTFNLNSEHSGVHQSFCAEYQRLLFPSLVTERLPADSEQSRSQEQSLSQSYPLLFLVLASDGLWDVMSNQEASEFVCEYLLEVMEEDEQQESVVSQEDLRQELSSSADSQANHNDRHRVNDSGSTSTSTEAQQRAALVRRHLPVDAFHEVSRLLAQEALVRGSADNIGVCVVDLIRMGAAGPHETL